MTPATRELLRAAARGDANRLRALLVQGTDINSTNQANQTALMLAAAFKRVEIVKLLLASGASVSIEDELGLTAADWANQQSEITELINAASKPIEPTRQTEPTKHERPNSRPLVPEHQPSAPPMLKGLAGAILRDYKPQTVDRGVRPQPAAPPQVSEPAPQPFNEETIDETLNRPTVSEDTLTRAVPGAARSRIFDLNSPAETPRAASKVDIEVPAVKTSSSNRWLLWVVVVLVLLVGGAFGSYRLAYLLTTRTNRPALPQPTPTPVVQLPKPNKLGPVVGGELAGAALYVPDAQYPSDSKASGNVTVNIRVSKKGMVVSARAIDGDQSLHSAAEKAAKSAAFSPDKLGNKASIVDGTITYNFSADHPGRQTDLVTNTSSGLVATTGGPLTGTELRLVQPELPASLRDQTGSITVVVRVNRAGKVVSWRLLDVDQRLRPLTIKAARASTFDPAKLPGKGDVVGFITYTFR